MTTAMFAETLEDFQRSKPLNVKTVVVRWTALNTVHSEQLSNTSCTCNILGCPYVTRSFF
jgi:hypothetical protein